MHLGKRIIGSMSESPKPSNIVRMWWEYRQRWSREWWYEVRSGKGRDHVLSALGSGIGVLYAFWRGWITKEHLASILLTAVLGYLLLLLFTWGWHALFVSSRIYYEQREKISALEASFQTEHLAARQAKADFHRRAGKIEELEHLLHVARGELEPMRRQLSDAEAAIAKAANLQQEMAQLKSSIEEKDKELSRLKSPELPELRPNIVPVRYAKLPDLPVLGLETANDGEVAYELSVPSVKLGTSVVVFDGYCPRLTKTDEHLFWRVFVMTDTRSTTTGNGLRNEMVRQGIGEMVVPIQYKDGDNRWYATKCRLELDVSVRGSGIAVHNDGQEIIAAPTREKHDLELPKEPPQSSLSNAPHLSFRQQSGTLHGMPENQLGFYLLFTNDETRYESIARNVRASLTFRHYHGDESAVDGVWLSYPGGQPAFSDQVSLGMNDSAYLPIVIWPSSERSQYHAAGTPFPPQLKEDHRLKLGQWSVEILLKGIDYEAKASGTLTLTASGLVSFQMSLDR